MDSTLIFRKAEMGDAARIMQIIRRAQARMREAGSDQWQDGYPAPEHVAADIARGQGYVLCKAPAKGSGAVIACGAVLFDVEPAYEALRGAWLGGGPYVTVHRLAVADEELGRGTATQFMHRVETLARERGFASVRIDTHTANTIMLRLIERLAYVYCGKVVYRSGERLAYEKRL